MVLAFNLLAGWLVYPSRSCAELACGRWRKPVEKLMMTSKIRTRFSPIAKYIAVAVLTMFVEAAFAQAPSRFVGTVTSISGTTLTVKSDAGDSRQVDVPGHASLKRIEPGQKDLS